MQSDHTLNAPSAQELQTKNCAKCREVKTLDDFPIDVSRADGHYVYCRLCVNQRARQTRAQDVLAAKANNPAKYAPLSGEIFMDIPGYDGKYQASNLGRVRSFSFIGHGRILRQTKTPRGYVHLTLVLNGVKLSRSVHSLVLQAFTGIRPDGMVINHKDGNPSNNHLENLEWVTPSENARHSLDVLGNPKQSPPVHYGENHPQSKLTRVQVDEIRALRESQGLSSYALADMYGVSGSTIKAILNRKTWK